MSPARRALVVRGGWDGHAPVACTDLFLPALADAGFTVEVSEDLEVYQDEELLARTDLIVQCWSLGRLTRPQSDGLVAAVRAGTGFAGWHGGVVGTFTDSTDYLRMVGGLFLHHPEQHLDYRVRIAPAHRDHPIVAGLGDFAVHTERYWMLTDAHNTVLAATTVHPSRSSGPEPDDGTGDESVEMPVVWTREWGRGRIFFSAIGHQPEDLTAPVVRTLTTRGLLWAAR
jgi:uncharacterized protein